MGLNISGSDNTINRCDICGKPFWEIYPKSTVPDLCKGHGTGYVEMLAMQGWQCPVCKTIWAPSIAKCECTKKPPKTISNANSGEYTVADTVRGWSAVEDNS